MSVDVDSSLFDKIRMKTLQKYVIQINFIFGDDRGVHDMLSRKRGKRRIGNLPVAGGCHTVCHASTKLGEIEAHYKQDSRAMKKKTRKDCGVHQNEISKKVSARSIIEKYPTQVE